MIFNNKKGYMTSSKAFMIGLFLGLLVALGVFLAAKGVLPFPVCG
ncbi:MAG: hypothetical protein ACLFNB_03945 [Candidatus Woesearchaeota archaeon]